MQTKCKAARHVLILAAGKSERAGMDKLLYRVCGKPIIQWTVDAFVRAAQFMRIVLVVPPNKQHTWHFLAQNYPMLEYVDGGLSRADSVVRALEYLAQSADVQDHVWVHDGARACVTPCAIRRLITMVDEVLDRTACKDVNVMPETHFLPTLVRGCIVAEPCVDSIKRVVPPKNQQGDNFPVIQEHCDRCVYWRAQTPQIASLGILLDSYIKAHGSINAITDEATALGIAGHQVAVLPSPIANPKITFVDDLLLVERLLAKRIHAQSYT